MAEWDARAGGNVAMLHVGRCGSKVVGAMLGQHPQVVWAGEFYLSLFQQWRKEAGGLEQVGEMPQDALEMLSAAMPVDHTGYYGIEVKPFHIHGVGYSHEDYLEGLDRLGFTHYVLLDRRNRLRKTISGLVARSPGGTYHISHGMEPSLRPVRVDVDAVAADYAVQPLVDFLDGYERDVTKLEGLLEQRRSLHLVYEEDVQDDPNRAYRRVCDFLCIEPRGPRIEYERTNPFPLREIIENDDEVEAALAGTPYAWMLDA